MRIQAKIFIALTLAMLALFVGILVISYQNVEQKVFHESLSTARDIRAFIMSMRRVYHHQFLDSGVELNRRTVGFLPAHSLSLIAEDFQNWTQSGIRFNAVSDRPRNPGNKADALELAAMDFFRKNPNQNERMLREVDIQTGKDFYHYTRPIWIEQYCLKCHGRVKDAPKTIQTQYQQSYDYEVGQLRGVLSIKIPIKIQYEEWLENLLKVLPILLVTWLGLTYWFRQHIGLRLEKLQGIAKCIGRGEYSLSVGLANNDEIGNTIKTMDTMATRIFQREQSIKQANILYKILSMTNELLLRRVSTEQIFQEVCHIAVNHGQFNLAWIGIFDNQTGRLKLLAVDGPGKGFVQLAELENNAHQAYPNGILRYILEGRTVIINDIQTSDLSGYWIGLVKEFDILSTAQVPFIINSKVIGVLAVCSPQCDYFRPEVIHLLQEVCRDVSFALDINEKEQERIQASEQVAYISMHDQLTGLPNRNWLLNRLKQIISGAIHHHHIGAILYLDIDNFKLINDSLGQQIGDEVLRQTATDILEILHEEDSLVRGSSDEFIILLTELSDIAVQARQEAENIAEKIQQQLVKSRVIDQNRIDIHVSIGIAMFPLDHKEASELIQCAATALHAAKQQGQQSICFYHQEMQLVLNQRLNLEAELRTALESEQFEMYYQPQIDPANNSFVGAEALIRWIHPQKGMVPPDQFIPVLEESGLIIGVGQWIMQEVFSQASQHLGNIPPQYPESGQQQLFPQSIPKHNVRVAINISPLQFQQSDFIEQVKQIMNETAVDPQYIEFEITENLLISDTVNSINKMTELKELGFSFSLDDFGTGYSSLAYLKQLPLDVIKIDRVFISTMLKESSSADIVETILDIANRFRLKVVAEGVETEAELRFLKQRQCDVVQGYFYSKPLAQQEFLQDYVIPLTHAV